MYLTKKKKLVAPQLKTVYENDVDDYTNKPKKRI